MASLSRGLRTLALASESQRAFKAAADRRELVRKTAEQQQGNNRGLATEQSTRSRLAEAARRAYARNRGISGGMVRDNSVQRMASLLRALDSNRGKPLGQIFAKRRN